MNTDFTAALKHLIKNLNASADFFRQARIDIGDRDLPDQFQSLTQLHERFAATLQPYMISSLGEQENGRELGVEWRKYLSHFMAKLKNRPEQTYQSQVTAVKKETLRTINKAMQLSRHKVIADQLRAMRDEINAHYSAILTTQHKIAA